MYLCAAAINFTYVFMIFLLDFGIVTAVWYFLVFHFILINVYMRALCLCLWSNYCFTVNEDNWVSYINPVLMLVFYFRYLTLKWMVYLCWVVNHMASAKKSSQIRFRAILFSYKYFFLKVEIKKVNMFLFVNGSRLLFGIWSCCCLGNSSVACTID